MPTLLLKVKTHPIKAHRIFTPRLFIYEDLIVIKTGNPLVNHEITLTYGHVSQVKLHNGPFFSTIEIISTGSNDNIKIPHVYKKKAISAKKLIDQKIFQAHHKEKMGTEGERLGISGVEMSVNRLYELYLKGRISKAEYEKKKAKILDKN